MTKDFLSLVEWVAKLVENPQEVHYVMEATGVYHQKIAYF